MQKVKWLYAAFFALSFALACEWAGSFAVQNNLEWFLNLNLPSFITMPPTFTAVYCAASILEAYVVSASLVKGVVNPTIGLYAAVKFSSTLFLALFFVCKSTLGGIATITVTLALFWIFSIEILKSRTGKLAKSAIPLLLVWYSYLWSVTYAVTIMN